MNARKERDLLRLKRILEVKAELDDCIEKHSITRESILADRDTRWMVSMPLLDITEQVSALSREFVAQNEIPDFKAIKGMRNRLVHGYGDVDHDYIADAVFDDIPLLALRCEELLHLDRDDEPSRQSS